MLKLKVSFPGRISYLSLIRGILREVTTEENISVEHANEIILSVDEALTNIIEHAYTLSPGHKFIYVSLASTAHRFIIIIDDRGKSFNPVDGLHVNIADSVQKRGRHGYGIYIMKHFMDRIVHKTSRPRGNRLILEKKLPSAPLDGTNGQ